jgi:predicted N-acetyltransferase YhbS
MRIRPIASDEEVYQVYEIERRCYPPEAAATLDAFLLRREKFSDFFLVAEDHGTLVGVLNGVRTEHKDMSDEGLKGAAEISGGGSFFCILTVAVKPTHRQQGIGAELVKYLIEQARKFDIIAIILMCEVHLIDFYRKLGFQYDKPSSSTHGGIRWHEMIMTLQH